MMSDEFLDYIKRQHQYGEYAIDDSARYDDSLGFVHSMLSEIDRLTIENTKLKIYVNEIETIEGTFRQLRIAWMELILSLFRRKKDEGENGKQ